MVSPPSPAAGGAAPAALRRALARHWAATLALTLFLTAGLAVLDDYGVAADETIQRRLAAANLNYAAGGPDSLSEIPFVKFYGMAFELPVFLANRAIGEDPRAVYLSRHLLTHLFYLVGGAFAYLLAHRLFNSRLLALFAMLLFLLHPRLWSHSFYNSKDIPFFAMLMITLFLAHRAFKRDSLAAFLLLGVGVGALMNLRAVGAVVLAAVPSMRALDCIFASERGERKRVLLTTAAFLLAAAATAYASLPYAWKGPTEWVEYWRVSSNYPHTVYEAFRGSVLSNADFPPDYVATWFSITAPPFMLLLGLVGMAAALRRSAASPRAALANSRLRFSLFLIGCFALPVVAVILADATIYNGWRQMQFLWAPFALLATFGLAEALRLLRRARLRAAVYGAAGAGVAASLISMTLIHPHQQVYFNFLVDRATPERIRTQYVMDYWGVPAREALERLLAASPSPRTGVNGVSVYGDQVIRNNASILPQADRERVSAAATNAAYASSYVYQGASPPTSAAHTVKVYNNTIMAISPKPDLEAAYTAALSSEPVIRGATSIYVRGGSAVYVKEPCRESDPARLLFYLRVRPQNPEDLPPRWRDLGVERRDFSFPGYGAALGDKCVASVPIPEYRAGLVTSRYVWGGETLWTAKVTANPELYRAARGRVAGENPAARSVFDVHLADRELIYVKDPCAQADAEPRFFLHVTPQRTIDLPERWREYGFENRDFDFFTNGSRFDGACVASALLPEYPVAHVRTGQFVSGRGELWRTRIAVDEE